MVSFVPAECDLDLFRVTTPSDDFHSTPDWNFSLPQQPTCIKRAAHTPDPQ